VCQSPVNGPGQVMVESTSGYHKKSGELNYSGITIELVIIVMDLRRAVYIIHGLKLVSSRIRS
jgi:hypothetical protein